MTENDKSLYCGKFLELKVIETPDYSYEYMHQTRGDGRIVAVLPFHKTRGIIVRKELTPSWGRGMTLWTPDRLHLNSITGGVEHKTPVETALHELEEEAGIVLHTPEKHLLPLGTTFVSKAADTEAYLFAVELVDGCFDEVDMKTDGSYLEQNETYTWVDNGEFFTKIPHWLYFDASDVLLSALFTRVMHRIHTK